MDSTASPVLVGVGHRVVGGVDGGGAGLGDDDGLDGLAVVLDRGALGVLAVDGRKDLGLGVVVLTLDNDRKGHRSGVGEIVGDNNACLDLVHTGLAVVGNNLAILSHGHGERKAALAIGLRRGDARRVECLALGGLEHELIVILHGIVVVIEVGDEAVDNVVLDGAGVLNAAGRGRCPPPGPLRSQLRKLDRDNWPR